MSLFAKNDPIIASGTAITGSPLNGNIPKPENEPVRFSVQIIWTIGDAADATAGIQMRNNEDDDWTAVTIINNSGTHAETFTLDMTSAGSQNIEFDSASAPFMRLQILKGANTTGTIGATVTGHIL